jgi:putative transposase
MSHITLRKTYQEKLRPTPAQERALEDVLCRCRELYNAALEQRITAWQRRRVSLSRYEQEAELKDLRAEFPAYAAIHSHVLQEVLARLDRTYQAFFRRVQRGEKAGFPRFKGRHRFHSVTYKEYGNGARLDNGCLVLSKIGRISVHWSRPIEGTPKTVTISHEADGWYVAISCADVPVHVLPSTGLETGLDLGLDSFAMLADGQRIFTPATIARRKPIYGAALGASHGARRAATDGAKPSRCWPRRTSTSPASDATSITRKPASSSKRTT